MYLDVDGRNSDTVIIALLPSTEILVNKGDDVSDLASYTADIMSQGGPSNGMVAHRLFL